MSPPSAPSAAARASWTCSRCAVTASWMPGAAGAGQPVDWRREGDHLHCLSCRRDLAAEAADAGLVKADSASRTKARTAAMIEFEIRRVPERANSLIARACRTSVPAVAKARQRLGIPAP